VREPVPFAVDDGAASYVAPSAPPPAAEAPSSVAPEARPQGDEPPQEEAGKPRRTGWWAKRVLGG
jgi:hypothetical protein